MTAAVAQPAPRQWSVALFGALLLHAGLAAVFHHLTDVGTIGAGRAGIEVGLGLAGGVPGEASGEVASQEVAEVPAEPASETESEPAEVAEALPEEPDPVEPQEIVAAAEPPPPAVQAVVPEAVAVPEVMPLYAPVESIPDLAEQTPAEAVVAEPPLPDVAEAQVVAEVEVPEATVSEIDPAKVVPAETVTAEAAMPLPPLPRSKPKPPQVASPVQPEPVEPTPAEMVQPVAEPQMASAEFAAAVEAAKTARSEATTQGPPRQADQSGTDGKAGKGGGPASSTVESRSGGGNPGAIVDYETRIVAWLQKHQEYPRRARLRRQEGVATLYFVIDRGGRVLDFRVEKGTGYKLLDEEVMNTIKRASPLPPPPESVAGDTLEYRIPVTFEQY